MRISGCLITKNGITCLERNIINDYIFGYISIRLLEIIAKDIITKTSNKENFNFNYSSIDFS